MPIELTKNVVDSSYLLSLRFIKKGLQQSSGLKKGYKKISLFVFNGVKYLKTDNNI